MFARVSEWFKADNRRARRPSTYRPRVEALESRRLLAVTLTVDDDLVQKPDADYTSIQDAVDAASAGDTIKVYPGSYAESVNVDKTLSILGAQETRNARRRSIDPTREAIVDTPATGTAGFHLAADNILIKGFTIQDVSGLPGLPSAGISTSSSFSGYQIVNNRIQHNTLGVKLESDGGATSLLRINYFNDNNEAGLDSGYGILSNGGLSDAEIRGNYFTDQAVASMEFDGAAMLLIAGNRLIDDAPMVLSNTTDSVVTTNVSRGSNGDGLLLDTCSDIEIRFNQISEAAGSGIKLVDSHDNLLEVNVCRKNGQDGIRLVNGDDNTIRFNYAIKNSRDGIRLDADSEGNSLDTNISKRNGEHDFHDDSSGAGTAGTANTWTGNIGNTENRPGLIA